MPRHRVDAHTAQSVQPQGLTLPEEGEQKTKTALANQQFKNLLVNNSIQNFVLCFCKSML